MDNKLGIEIILYRGDEEIAKEMTSQFSDAEEILGSMERRWNKDVERAEAQAEAEREGEIEEGK